MQNNKNKIKKKEQTENNTTNEYQIKISSFHLKKKQQNKQNKKNRMARD